MTQQTPTPHAPQSKTLLERIGGRKFILFAVIELVACIALFLGLIGEVTWKDVTLAVIGGYGLTNAATHWAHRLKPSFASTPSTQGEPRADL